MKKYDDVQKSEMDKIKVYKKYACRSINKKTL